MSKKSFFKYDMLLLSILKKKDCYGYEIISMMNSKTDSIIKFKEGTLYPILYSLLKDEYISSYDVIFNKKIRVYYSLNEKGKHYLLELIEEYKKMIDAIDKIIN